MRHVGYVRREGGWNVPFIGNKQMELVRADGFVKAKDWAEAVGVSSQTIHRALAAGTLPGKRHNGSSCWLVDVHAAIRLTRYDGEIRKRVEALAKTVGRRARS